MKKQTNKGFTLVELSIVLVIIGLLIGGILVAQSMIGTAKIQALTRQLGQFDAAVGNFVTRFNGLPGDTNSIASTVMGTPTTAGHGNGDGIITDYTASAANVFSGEIGTFWNALSLTGLSTGGQGTSGTTYAQAHATAAATLSVSGTSANIPKAAAGSATSGFVAYGTAAGQNYYSLLSTAQYSASAFIAGSATNGALKPADALAIDVKIDDGAGAAGNVQAASTSAASGPAAAVVAGCYASSAYVVATSTEACNLNVRMGTQTGLVQ